MESIAHGMDSNRNTINSGPTRVDIYTSDVLFGMDYSLEQNATGILMSHDLEYDLKH